MIKVIASEVVKLDSNVNTGGGTDVTEKLQGILDLAPKNGGLHLIMDGAALVSGLKVHSDTTIECINRDCGFFMKDNANRNLITNYNADYKNINTKNLTFINGTYNQNCTKQVQSVTSDEFPNAKNPGRYVSERHFTHLMELEGVENLKITDVKFKNQRVYTLSLANFKNVVMENVSVDMAEHVHPSNQDGFHFFGPGRFLTMKNIRGCTGDDFINFAPDEHDGESSITDIYADGIFFDDVCQGIRMLSRENGVLDRVTLRNVVGTYKTFAFSINPFFRGKTYGHYGDIFIENVDVRQLKETYHYTPLSFMGIGGDMDCITLKNVRFRNPVRNSTFIDLGRPFFYRPKELTEEEMEKYCITDFEELGRNADWMPEGVRKPIIKTFILDNVIFESDEKADDMNYVELKYNIDNFIARNIKLFRGENAKTSGYLIKTANDAKLKNVFLENVYAEKVESVFYADKHHEIDFIDANNVILKQGKNAIDTEKALVKKEIRNSVYDM